MLDTSWLCRWKFNEQRLQTGRSYFIVCIRMHIRMNIPQVPESWNERHPDGYERILVASRQPLSPHCGSNSGFPTRAIRSTAWSIDTMWLFPSPKVEMTFDSALLRMESEWAGTGRYSKEIWRNCTSKDWFRRTQLCIACGGGYTEIWGSNVSNPTVAHLATVLLSILSWILSVLYVSDLDWTCCDRF